MNEFLRVEYEQCLALIKFYDERYTSLVKFAAGLSSAVPSVIFGLGNIGNSSSDIPWLGIAFLSMMTALGLLAIFSAMVQNRLYFVYPARQVNAIRASMLETVKDTFTTNRMYLDSDFKPFKWRSSHTALGAFVCLQFGMFVGLGAYSASISLGADSPIVQSIFIGIPACVLAFATAARYLVTRSNVSADKGVHK